MTFPTRLAAAATALALVVGLATTGFGGRPPAAPTVAATTATDANITRLTTEVLENAQLAHRPFDRALAGTLLDRYVDELDGSRSLLLQSDVDELSAARATLAHDTRESGDTHVATALFARYLERLQQRASFVDTALQTMRFDFAGHDTFSYDRAGQPRPRDLAAARELWRQQLRAEVLQEKLRGKTPDAIAQALRRRYEQQQKTMRSLKSDEILEVYLDTLAHVYDPHSDYLGREEAQSLSIAMNLSLAGIGATLSSEDGYCVVRDLVPGGPAARSGFLAPGDRITAVAQAGQEPVDIVDMPLTRAVELIRGPKGSTVRLSIVPAGAPQGSPPAVRAIVRDEVKLSDQEARAQIVELPVAGGATRRLGVIDLPSFYADVDGHGVARRSATADVARLLTKLKQEHVQGIVLDVRHNGGGSLQEAITLTGLFIPTGPVVQTRDQAGAIEVGDDTDASVQYGGPLVVLTSRLSASATEILAGALQDYGRALVVGDPSTFGKGTVQTVLPLARLMDRAGLAHAYDPGELKITIAKFYRPSGASTQLRGVASDIVIPSTTDLADVSERTLDNPLPWDTVPAKPFARADRVGPFLAALREASSRRVASDPDFVALSGDLARLHAARASKTVSLNEAERRAELARLEAERKAQVARAAGGPKPVTYSITLENLGAPGLPPPIATPAPSGSAARPAPGAAAADVDALATPAHDIVLGEAERVLSDYVERTGGTR